MGSAELPTFPCWCRATYSWGGETKKDLGFIEGDLIEALNAGDGQWWMGRLRRDPRAIGLFPSNFVAVLDRSFQPTPNSRNASPMTHTPPKGRTSGQAIAGGAAGSPAQTVFRKPFQAYGSIKGNNSASNSREGTPESERERAASKKSKFRPYSSMKTAQAPSGSFRKQNGAGSGTATPTEEPEANGFRMPQPPPRGRRSRAASPLVPQEQSEPAPTYRAASPLPPTHRPSTQPSRPRSPLPTTFHDGSAFPQILPASRQPSPNTTPTSYQQTQTPTHSHVQSHMQFSPHPIATPLSHSRSQSHYESHHQHYSMPHSYSPSPDPGYDRYDPPPEQMDYEDDADDGGSSPPPPPPVHRVVYQAGGHTQHGNDYRQDDYPDTPAAAPSPSVGNMTPSPLRDAMNDVMNSLQDMGMSPPPEPIQRAISPPSVWSPEAYDLVRKQSQQRNARAQSTSGFAPLHYSNSFSHYDEHASSLPSSRDGPITANGDIHRVGHPIHRKQPELYSNDHPPAPPLKGSQYAARPDTASSNSSAESSRFSYTQRRQANLRHRKSAYELGRGALDRTFTTKTNATNSTASSSATQSSASTQLTSRSIMSGHSAGGFSATSAGSLARRKFGLGSLRGRSTTDLIDTRAGAEIHGGPLYNTTSDTSGSGPSYHLSHSSSQQPAATAVSNTDWMTESLESGGVLGGLSAPKAKKSGFFRKMIDNAKTTARTGAATARSTIGSRPGSRPGSRSGSVSPTKSLTSGFGVSMSSPSTAARDMGLGGGGAGSGASGSEWMQVRRDVNRSNSLSRRERDERIERCQMLDISVINPIDQLHELAEGDEGLDGLPVTEPTDFNMPNLALVDKSARFIQSVPPMIGVAALAQSYICRPHRSGVQRLRAIFTWVAERITWEEDFEGEVDVRRVVQTRRGTSRDIAVLVHDMCSAISLHAEIVHGYLKAPGEVLDMETLAAPNHWWNAVIVDGEWRILDCALASPTHARRSMYSSVGSQIAEPWYFLARPLEICYTHIPLLPEQQHIVPPLPHEVLIALPCACPPYFRNAIELADFDTSMLHLDNLEMVQLQVSVPEDVECVAEVEARAFAQDADGDLFESGEMVRKAALAQPEWSSGHKRFTVKAVLPGDDGRGVLKIYAGKRGLMHSVKDNPHALAMALPIFHSGRNPPYDFLVRHPTPHAQRHDLYVAQPQCTRLGLNNTFVFCVRQHPSSLSRSTSDPWGTGSNTGGGFGGVMSMRPTSPNPYGRPGSAMSMVSASTSQAGSNYSNTSSAGDPTGAAAKGNMTASAQQKPAKLAIQSPSQKIIRLTRKLENGPGGSAPSSNRNGLNNGGDSDGVSAGVSTWETVIKIGERGTWRGLVLADRSARWCVFAEWECV